MRSRLKQGRIAPRLAAVVLLFAAVCGCEKEAVPTKGTAPAETNKTAALPRTQDAAYNAKLLRDIPAKRNVIAAQRHEIVAKMENLVARARAALPAGATEDQVREEILNNPKKYPGWQELARILQARNARADKELEDARRLVMARIRQEQAELSQTDLSKRGGSK